MVPLLVAFGRALCPPIFLAAASEQTKPGHASVPQPRKNISVNFSDSHGKRSVLRTRLQRFWELRNFDMTARYVDQGGGKRKGSFAIYLEPWHADVFDFLDLKKNHGK